MKEDILKILNNCTCSISFSFFPHFFLFSLSLYILWRHMRGFLRCVLGQIVPFMVNRYSYERAEKCSTFLFTHGNLQEILCPWGSYTCPNPISLEFQPRGIHESCLTVPSTPIPRLPLPASGGSWHAALAGSAWVPDQESLASLVRTCHCCPSYSQSPAKFSPGDWRIRRNVPSCLVAPIGWNLLKRKSMIIPLRPHQWWLCFEVSCIYIIPLFGFCSIHTDFIHAHSYLFL